MSRLSTIMLSQVGYSAAQLAGTADGPDGAPGAVPVGHARTNEPVPLASAPKENGVRLLIKVVSTGAAGGYAYLTLNQGAFTTPGGLAGGRGGSVFVMDMRDDPSEFFLEPGDTLVGMGSVLNVEVSIAESPWYGYKPPCSCSGGCR